MQSIKIGNTVIEYNVVRTDRKTVGITIDPVEGVIVRSPKKVSKEKIENIVNNKSDWILQKLTKLDDVKSTPAPKELLSGEKLPYLGRRYRLKVIKDSSISKKQAEVKLYQGKFIAKLSSSVVDDELRIKILKNKLIKWYRKHAEIKINNRVNKYKTQIGVKPNKVKIKKQKKRWGSCSNKGNLNFNWKLIMAPMSIVDYIVIHELAHLKYQNHSNEFWELVETIIPDYEKRQEWLRIHGPELDIKTE